VANVNYAEIKYCDIANGPGVRTSVFVSGCTHRCKGCFNEIAWDFDYGKPFTDETIREITDSLAPAYITGLTVLGGEPFEPENQSEVLRLLKAVRAEYPKKSIWCFTGYLFDKDLLGNMCHTLPHTRELLEQIDVLVDGPFILEQKDLMLKFKGSANQRTIDVPASLKSGNVVWVDL
jgi:anaerobic ribonucleoside-triphosphate reductase activating protein